MPTQPTASTATPSSHREPLPPVTLTRTVSPNVGITTVEYLILLVLLAAVSVGIWKTFGADVGEVGRHGSFGQAGTGAPESILRNIA